MKRRHNLVKLLLSASLLVTIPIRSQNPTTPPVNPPTPIPLKDVPSDSDRKRMPSKNDYLYFSYNSLLNECAFIIPSNIAWLDIEFISPEGISMFAHVTSDYPTCNIAFEKGIHHIICTADDGRIFEGDVCID